MDKTEKIILSIIGIIFILGIYSSIYFYIKGKAEEQKCINKGGIVIWNKNTMYCMNKDMFNKQYYNAR